MELTRKQEEGLKIAVERFKKGEPYTVISGYAGSGKSTLIKFIIAALNLHESEIAYVAYTGKAANVLKQKGCPNATTAHKLLYYAKQMPSGGYIFRPKVSLEDNYKLIVVDEVSMLPKDMWELLLRHRIYVLACGDPGQLPPIDKTQINGVLDHPHIFLDEIMRQAQDSAIIRLSMDIRAGKDFKDFGNVSGEVRIIKSSKELYANEEDYIGCLLGADQVLCSMNAQRNSLNQAARRYLGRGADPEIGDKVIGLHNHWDFLSIQMTALTNGAIGKLTKFQKYTEHYPEHLRAHPVDLLVSEITMEDGDVFEQVPIDYDQLRTGTPSLDPKTIYRINTYLKNYKGATIPPLAPYDFAYGYAITTWKAQGSEWDLVLGFDAPWLRNRDKVEYTQYLYTLATRASKTLIMVGA